MMSKLAIILFLNISLFLFVQCNYNNNDKVLGIQTAKKVKIDKDTIINSNLKLQSKNRNQNSIDETDPDWSYEPIPSDREQDVFDFKRNMSLCIKEASSKPKKVTRLSPKYESPIHERCVTACFFKKAGVIEDKKINKGNLLNLVNKFFAKDTKMMKKLTNNIDRCIEISTRVKDECDLAARLNDCTNDLMAGNKHTLSIEVGEK